MCLLTRQGSASWFQSVSMRYKVGYRGIILAERLDVGTIRKRETVVLGGGPSGLGTALGISLNGGYGRVALVEKENRAGGLAGSFHWKKHTIDYGPHRLSPNIDVVRLLADELLGPDCLIKKNRHGVQFKKKLYQFPPRVSDWLSPFSFWQLIAFIFSFLVTKILWITWRFKSDTFETTIMRKFGKRFHRLVVSPMTEKVWAHPDSIDPAFVNQRFSLVRPSAVIRKLIFPKQDLNPSQFYYPRNGFRQLWDNMADYLEREGNQLMFNTVPKRIELKDNRITHIHLMNGKKETTLETRDLTVVSTIPLTSFVSCLRGYETEELKADLKNVQIRSLLLVAFEFNQQRTLPFRTLIFPERDYCFNRLFEQNQYSIHTVSEGRSVVVADITLPFGHQEMKSPDIDIIEKVKKDLRKLPYIRLDKLTDAHVERVEFGYVVPDKETRRRICNVLHVLKGISNLVLLGRFATGEYDNSDYAIDNGLTLGAMLTGRISKLEYLSSIHSKRGRYIVG